MVFTEKSSAPTAQNGHKSHPSEDTSASYKDTKESPVVEEVEVRPEAEVDADDCPDGGLRAWLCVVGAVCGMCATIGLVNAWGAFQAYYQQVELKHHTASEIAWIGSIQNAMRYFPGLLAGRLFDNGHLRVPVLVASAVFVTCMFLTAECTQYWQFLLCQGFGLGLSSGVFFTMVNMMMTHWFKKKLGIALACMYAGAGVGGCLFPVITRTLLRHLSFPWTQRILAFITLALLTVTNLTIARRLPAKRDHGPMINLAEFKKPMYSIYIFSLFINTLALFTGVTYLTISAVRAGINVNMAFGLLSIANATSTFARLGAGLLTDRFGSINVLIGAAFMNAIITYAWPFATNLGGFVPIAMLIGTSSGAIIATLVHPFTRMGPVSNVGVRIGMGLTIAAFGVLAGPPISGAIVDSTGSYKGVGYYAGSMSAFSGVVMLVVRHLMLKAGVV